MDRTIDHFHDVHAHAASVREWSQTYCQLTRGALQSSLLQVVGQRFQIFREHINQRVVQNGEAPRGRVCFAVPLRVPGAARMQGREADESSVFVLQGGDEFMFHMPMGTELLAITFDQRSFDQAIAEHPRPDELAKLLRQPVLRISPSRVSESRSRLLGLFERALCAAGMPTSDLAHEHEIQRALMAELIGLLSGPECDKGQRHGSSSGSYIVERCHRMTLADTLNPPSVLDLCERMRVSRRSVQNGFRSVADTTPINYIRCLRLNGVRRELMRTRAGEVSIGDAAARWGFYHLSHFAADYRELFGELPSQTRGADGMLARMPAKLAATA